MLDRSRRGASERGEGADKKLNNAMWVWHNENLKTDEKIEALVSYCNKYFINHIFLQVPAEYEGEGDAVTCKLGMQDEYRKFIARAREKGILVHALDGYKKHVLPEWQPKVLAQVRALIEFNRNSKPEERYYGIHYDNEPYLLPGWNSNREQILEYYLDLNHDIVELMKKEKSKMVYGVDIPFWWDTFKEDGRPQASVEWNGERKTALEHTVDIVDNIGIMDYRNSAQGADGTIAHGIGEIEYAREMGKQVWIGLETIQIEPAKITFYGMSAGDLESCLDQTTEAFSEYDSFYGFAFHYYKTLKEIWKP